MKLNKTENKNLIKKITISIITLITILTIGISVTYATQSISITPTSISDSINVGNSGYKNFIIKNTGDEPINISINKTEIKNGDSTLDITLNCTEITNLPAGENRTIKISYDTDYSDKVGTYKGNLNIYNKDNTSMNETLDLSITLNPEKKPIDCIEFVDEGTTLDMNINVDDSSESKTFTIRNTCHQTIENIKVRLDEKLDGEDHNDEIDRDDVEFNGEKADEWYDYDDDKGDSFKLKYNETTTLKIRINIPSNLEVDDYKGDMEFEILFDNSSTYYTDNDKFELKVEAYSDDDDIYFENNLYVKSGKLEIDGEPGDTIDDIELRIKNDGNNEVKNVTLKIKEDLEEEDSTNKVDKENIIFKENNISIDDRDYEDVELKIKIPEDTPTGTYYGKIELYDKNGDKKDEITLKLRVVGDIYITKIDMPEKVIPDSDISVKIYVKNHGTKTYSNVKIYATIYDIDYGYSDTSENTNTFILDANEEKSYTLRFHIPERATDGTHNLEIRVKYDDKEFKEKKEIEVNRPINNVIINSFGINPPTIKCDKLLYGFIKYENLGKYDEEVITTMEIEGTNIKDSSELHTLRVDQIDTDNFNLNVGNLQPGTYKVIFKVNANGKIKKAIKTLTVLNCSNKIGIDIKPIEKNETTTDKKTDEDNSKITLFGKKIDKTTAYLGGGLTITIIGIIILGILLI